MSTKVTTYVTLKEFGESRRVEIYYYPDMTDNTGKKYMTSASPVMGRLFVARLGSGTKLHPTSLTLFTIDPQRGVPRGNTKVVAEDGSEWHYHKSRTILNKSNGYIVGWADKTPATSQHSGGRY